MLADAYASLRQIFTPPFRAVLYKTLALTIALLALLWLLLDRLALHFIASDSSWLTGLAAFAAGLGLFVGLAFLIAPVSMLVAGLFLDDLAAHAEADLYPENLRGRATPALTAMWLAVRFSAVALAVNFVAFCLWLLPGVNAVVFFVANAYLFGREYFELAAMRFVSVEDARALRKANMAPIFLAGLLIAFFVATPVLNLLTPLFGVALMVRLNKKLQAQLPASTDGRSLEAGQI